MPPNPINPIIPYFINKKVAFKAFPFLDNAFEVYGSLPADWDLLLYDCRVQPMKLPALEDLEYECSRKWPKYTPLNPTFALRGVENGQSIPLQIQLSLSEG